jgi:hypothetical protein
MKAQNLQLRKLDLKSKRGGLIQKCSSNHTTKIWLHAKKDHHKLSYNGSIQKMCVHALKHDYKLYYNGLFIFLWWIIRGGWIICDAHGHTIVCCSYYGFCRMLMSEQSMVLKCKSNCIDHKSFLSCASKPSTKKSFIVER